MFEAVTRLLAFLAHERPTVLLLDDLQWADTSTALLLGHLLRDAEATRLLVLGTFRDGVDVRCPELPALLSQLAREPSYERDRADRARPRGDRRSDRLLRRAPPSDSFVAAPARGHRGQPVLRQGDDAQPRRGVAERPRARARGPDRPGRRQGARRDAAGPAVGDRPAGAHRGLGGRPRVPPRAARGAAWTSRSSAIIAALEEASAAGLVDEVADDADRFVFPQALVRDTLYERQSGSRRVRLHHRIAQALEAARRRHARRARAPLPREPPPRPRRAGGRLRRAGGRDRGGRARLRGGRRALPARARALRRRGPAALRAAAGARRRRGPRRRPARGARRSTPPPSSPATASPSCTRRRRSAAPRAGRRAARSTARRSRGSRRRSRRSTTAR